MDLILQIRKDQIEARKAKNALAATLLTTVIGEAVMVAKNDQRENPTDAEVREVIAKFLKGIRDTQEALNKGNPVDVVERMAVVNAELIILESYMPKQLSETELSLIVAEAIANGTPKNMGALMGFLKTNYANQYEGKIAGQVVRAALAA
jgi:uncharacterized protein